ncbi:nucleoside triphosphate pyrophosphohydrolase [Bacillus sp. FJAT-45350]|uniref:nucleoside triphosphate pyrophosphohydrolase n=1 Tax=Bacillus sp. FJAT-45350 TaxID=2011014 RepID=UPI000BB6DDEC|nr:nucleoside triphosphate pyrophosphohydrolase [Bacillus sp. FJAT-45350]
MPTYNKLVRDKIPTLLDTIGKKYNVTELNEAEYKTELKTKLGEEVEEFLTAKDDGQAVEELADILELIHALANVHGATIEDVEKARKIKAGERGGFQKKVFLIDVEDK